MVLARISGHLHPYSSNVDRCSERETIIHLCTVQSQNQTLIFDVAIGPAGSTYWNGHARTFSTGPGPNIP